MNRAIQTGVIFSIIAIFLFISVQTEAASEVIYVCNGGDASDTYSGDTTTAFPTITAAINAVASGDGYDTIVVYSFVDTASY